MPANRAFRTAVVLAAGRGARIWPYGDTKPKAALPVCNRPTVATLADHLRAAGAQRIIVVVGHLEGAVRHALGPADDVEFVHQPTPTGTADALRAALPLVEDERFLVAYGDVATTAPAIAQLVDGAGDGQSVLLAPLGPERARDWICAQTAGDRVSRIYGHPRGEVEHRLAGVFALTRDIGWYLDAHPEFMRSVQVGVMPPRDRDLSMALQVMLEDGHAVRAVVTHEPLVDLDKPWHILEANARMLDVRAGAATADAIAKSATVHAQAEARGTLVLGENVYVGPRVVFQGNAWVGDGTIVDNGAIIGPNVMIGAGCEVRDYCKLEAYTVLGDGCHVGHAAEVAGVLFDNVWAVHYMELWGVIGSSSDLGAATVFGTLRFDDGATAQRVHGRREDARELGNACYLGDYTRTGVNAVLMPGRRVGPYGVVGPGVVLNEDVPNGTMITVEQTYRKRAWGPAQYGW